MLKPVVMISDNCRFPHILNPDGSAPVSPTSPRGGYPGSFGRVGNGSRRPTILGPTLEDKMADLSVKEVSPYYFDLVQCTDSAI